MPKKSKPSDALAIVWKSLDEIHPYEKNPRFNEEAVDPVAASIKEFGWKAPIVVSEDGEIVAGHTRFKAAQKLCLSQVPCIVASDLSPAQVRAFRLADNKTGELATWDWELLSAELDELKNVAPDLDMADFGFADMDVGALDEAMDANDVTEQDTLMSDDKYLLSLKMPIVHKEAIERFRKDNGDSAIESAVLSACGIEA